MRSIKGPRSALTDFIEESGIKLESRKNVECGEVSPLVRTRRPKRVKYAKPVEIVNCSTAKASEEDRLTREMLESADFGFDDASLRRAAEFLGRHRMMSQHYFDLLARSASKSLCVFDCSMIRDHGFGMWRSLRRLELFQCGQLSEPALNRMLGCMPEIEVLRITGGYLLESFEIPRTLKVLDVSNCSRLQDRFIDGINASFKRLEELRLSHCYGLTSAAVLTVEVGSLFICETKLSERFLEKASSLRSLSVKRCSNINVLPDLMSIEHLDAEGVASLKSIAMPESIRHLNASHCAQLEDFLRPGLEHLDVSYMCLSLEDLRKISQCRKLRYLNISWIPAVDDAVLEMMVSSLCLEKLVVFGCFGLTEDSARLAYSIRHRCEVVGNPSETRYLLENC